MMEIAVVGSEQFILGFRLAGIRKTVLADMEKIESRIDQVIEDRSVGILVLNTRDVERLSSATRKKLDSMPRPVVIAVGMREEEDLRNKVKRAIGVDLYRTQG